MVDPAFTLDSNSLLTKSRVESKTGKCKVMKSERETKETRLSTFLTSLDKRQAASTDQESAMAPDASTETVRQFVRHETRRSARMEVLARDGRGELLVQVATTSIESNGSRTTSPLEPGTYGVSVSATSWVSASCREYPARRAVALVAGVLSPFTARAKTRFAGG